MYNSSELTYKTYTIACIPNMTNNEKMETT